MKQAINQDYSRSFAEPLQKAVNLFEAGSLDNGTELVLDVVLQLMANICCNDADIPAAIQSFADAFKDALIDTCGMTLRRTLPGIVKAGSNCN